MDKNILLVTSETERATGKDLIAFHKSLRIVLNEQVINHTGIRAGYYADIGFVDKTNREIEIVFTVSKEKTHNRRVTDPAFSKSSRYLAVRSTQLFWEHNLCLFGAFEYKWDPAWKVMTIKY